MPRWTSSPIRASARCSRPTPGGRPSPSCSSTASWWAVATSWSSCTRTASSRSWLPRKGTVAVVGGGVLGLSVGHALAADGFRVTVHEQHAVGTPLGSSSGRSRIYRTSYDRPAYVRLARLAIEEWMRLDPALLLPLGLVETGDGAALSADALAACGEPHEWVSAERAAGLLPEAVF